MGYGVCNIEKAKGDGLRLAQHIERSIYKIEEGEDGERIVRVMEYTPGNVSKERTHLNKEYIPTEGKTLFERIDRRIKEALGNKKIRKDQVRYFDIVVSATYEDMEKIQEEGNLDKWCRMNTEWAQNFFGKDNVVGATLHMDEQTPHMHIPVVPIVSGETRKRKLKQSKGEGKARKYKKDLNCLRLSCDDMLSKDILKMMQTSHFETIGQVFGIKRGIEGSKAKHQTTRQYYANKTKTEIETLEEFSRKVEEKKNEEKEINARIKQMVTMYSKLVNDYNNLNTYINDQKKKSQAECDKIIREAKDYSNEIHACIENDIKVATKKVSYIYDLRDKVKEDYFRLEKENKDLLKENEELKVQADSIIITQNKEIEALQEKKKDKEDKLISLEEEVDKNDLKRITKDFDTVANYLASVLKEFAWTKELKQNFKNVSNRTISVLASGISTVVRGVFNLQGKEIELDNVEIKLSKDILGAKDANSQDDFIKLTAYIKKKIDAKTQKQAPIIKRRGPKL